MTRNIVPGTKPDTVPVRAAPRAPGKSFSQLVREDTKNPPPSYLLVDKSEWQGDEALDVDRYITREAHELEKEKIWKKVWQMACREEQVPQTGDSWVYDINDISILVVRVTSSEIKAYYNVCLHQGRKLRDGPSHDTELRCPFHGFCWTLGGKLAHFPSQWDFPQIEKRQFSLREVKVGRWGGFVFINMDPNCASLEDFIGDMPSHWEKFPLEDRYIALHVAKVFRANWKTAQEAFMEGYHNVATHLQFCIPFGGLLDSTQYDPMGNYSRAIGLGAIEAPLALQDPTMDECLQTLTEIGAPGLLEAIKRNAPPDVMSMIEFMTRFRRDRLRDLIGAKADDLSDYELHGGGYLTLFPNFHPWWAYDEIVYRFRPYNDDPEMCLMETYLLRPFSGERPKPAALHSLGPDDTHLDAPEMGELARIFYQDEFNIEAVQKGLHSLKAIGRGTTHGVYQAGKIRHFHRLWNRWVLGAQQVEGIKT
jgi:phenylpropionate dioxygenase-like ring-hydroxylating dioxygenase large terminal subunit